MLHKMYLVSSKHFKKLTPSKKLPSKTRKLPQIDYDMWIKRSEKLREEDVTRKTQLKDNEKFMKQVLSEPPVQRFEWITPAIKRRESLPTAEAEIAHKKPKFVIDDGFEVSDLDREYFGELAIPYLKPYLHNATNNTLFEGRTTVGSWFVIPYWMLTTRAISL